MPVNLVKVEQRKKISNERTEKKEILIRMKKAFEAVFTYLKDWRNWLSHTLVGVGILAVGLFLPVKPVYRIILLVVIIGFNIIRMRMSEHKPNEETGELPS